AYVTGYTTGVFPTTSGAFRTSYGGGSDDGFVAMLEPTAPTIVVSPPSLPGATVGVPYSRTLFATTTDALAAPLRFAMGGAPLGLPLNSSTGVLSGTPTFEGVYLLNVIVTDRGGWTGSQAYLLPVAPIITLSPAVLPNAILNQPYSQTVTATGGH